MGIGKLRNPLRGNEARDLDRGQACYRQCVDERDLAFGGHEPRQVLKPVARSDLVYRHLLRQFHGLSTDPDSSRDAIRLPDPCAYY